MSFAFNIVVHVLMISSMAVFGIVLYVLLLTADDAQERLLRSVALFAGAMVVLGAQAAGLSYADFIVKSFNQTKTTSIGLWGTALPGLAGLGVGWYFVHFVKKGNEDMNIRLLTFVGMLALTQFASVYAVAVSNKGIDLGKTVVPNICFCVALFLVAIFKVPTRTARARPPATASPTPRLLNRIVEMVEARRSTTPPPTDSFASGETTRPPSRQARLK